MIINIIESTSSTDAFANLLPTCGCLLNNCNLDAYCGWCHAVAYRCKDHPDGVACVHDIRCKWVISSVSDNYLEIEHDEDCENI